MAATVSIIVPTLNEAANLPHVLPRIPRVPEICEIMLVDGRSTDGTADVARELIPDIRVVNQTGKGKGNAIKSGAAAAVGEYFLILDADGSHRPEEIPDYIAKAEAGYDYVKGSRYLDGRATEDETFDRVLIVNLTYFVANTLWRTKYSDIGYGMFLINRRKFLDMNLRSDYLELEYELAAKAVKHKLRTVEIPAHEHARIHGESHLSYKHDGWLIFKTVMVEWLKGLIGR